MAASLEQGIPWYLLVVCVHILAAVFWTGYVLFWTIMTAVVKHDLNSSQARQVFQLASECKWPPGLIPLSYRLRIPALGWTFFFVLAISGLLILFSQGNTLGQLGWGRFFAGSQGKTMTAKLISVVGLAICQLFLTFQPNSRLPYLGMLLTILVIALSVLLVH
jgi:hypothetical protein